LAVQQSKDLFLQRKKCRIYVDKGYNYPEVEHEAAMRGYIPHIGQRGGGEKAVNKRRYPARRWVVERANSWHNRFRKLLVRHEKKVELSWTSTSGLLHNCIIP
jgi:hypothetical protein